MNRPLRCRIPCALILAALCAAVCAAQQHALAPEKRTQIDAAVSKFMATTHVPGLSIAIVENSDMEWASGYGFADLENNVPASAALKSDVSASKKSDAVHGNFARSRRFQSFSRMRRVRGRTPRLLHFVQALPFFGSVVKLAVGAEAFTRLLVVVKIKFAFQRETGRLWAS